MEAERTIIVIDFADNKDCKYILQKALRVYIREQIDVLKSKCTSTDDFSMDWDNSIADDIECAMKMYKHIEMYSTTKDIDDNSAVIRRKI